MTDTDTDVPTCHDHRRQSRGARTWSWAGTAVAAVVAAVVLAPAPLAAAEPAGTPAFAMPCQSDVLAFYNARQSVINHNNLPHDFTTQEQVNAYNAQGRAIFNIQMQDRQVALDCLRGLAGRAAPSLPDPVDHSAPTGEYPPAPTAPPAESGDGDWAEKMQDKIYDWFKENLERVEKYQEKQQEEQNQEQDHDRCGQATDAPPAPTADPSSTTTPTPAPPVCPAAPTTTTAPTGVPF
jgi:hypothetical protein